MIIDIKFKEVYKSFRLNCDYIIEDSNPQDINTLRFLMQQRGFRRKKDGTRLPPTDYQVTLAWDYISQKRVWDEPAQPKPTYILRWVSAYTYKRNNKEIHVKKYKRKRVWDEPAQPKPTYILRRVSAYTYKRNNKEIHVKKYKRKYKNV